MNTAPTRPWRSPFSKAAAMVTALLVTAALGLGSAAGAAPAAAAEIQGPDAEASAVSKADQQIINIFDGFNKVRKSKGWPAVRLGLTASTVNQELADKMARAQNFVESPGPENDPRIDTWSSSSTTNFRGRDGFVKEWLGDINPLTLNKSNQVIGIGLGMDTQGEFWASTSYYTFDVMPAKTFSTAQEYLKARNSASGSVFKDVPGHAQFAKEIAWMSDQGISTGYPDGTYRPLDNVARNAMAAFMYRLSGKPQLAGGASPFKDVRKNDAFAGEMLWLARKGVSTGWPDGTYRPMNPVNRDAMAAFMYRLAGSPKFTPPKKSPFQDVSTSNQFYKEISWLAAEGISTGWDWGYGVKKFEPGQPVKRDAMAAFMYRFAQNGYPVTK